MENGYIFILRSGERPLVSFRVPYNVYRHTIVREAVRKLSPIAQRPRRPRAHTSFARTGATIGTRVSLFQCTNPATHRMALSSSLSLAPSCHRPFEVVDGTRSNVALSTR